MDGKVSKFIFRFDEIFRLKKIEDGNLISNDIFFYRNNECQKYLRSLRYIDELQKFVEDNQWKRSLAIEPNQLKPDMDQENQDVLGHLNLSPSKMSAREHARVDRPFVPGHRRAKSDGCGMFMMKHKESMNQDAYKANYSHHLLDDSKLEEENLKSPSHTLPPNYLSSKKGSMERGGQDGGVMNKILRNPGIKCQHQVQFTKLDFFFREMRMVQKSTTFWRVFLRFFDAFPFYFAGFSQTAFTHQGWKPANYNYVETILDANLGRCISFVCNQIVLTGIINLKM